MPSDLARIKVVGHKDVPFVKLAKGQSPSASAVAAAVTRGVSGILRSVVWIVLAAYVYELERAARGNAR